MPLVFDRQLRDVDRCPQCNVAKPSLSLVWACDPIPTETKSIHQRWGIFQCSNCQRMIMAEGIPLPLNGGNARKEHNFVKRLYPDVKAVDKSLPEDAQRYLKQAIDTLFAPDASTVMAASAVDAMLRAKGFRDGSLYGRIDKAVQEHVLTEGMGRWAHKVRLGANAVRHADDATLPPTADEAAQVVQFASALGDFLFVFTARVEQGVSEAESQSEIDQPAATS
ncbi:DUF4145 domain-containing protein [Mesorhizobium sp. B2-6-2]|uniref:DUF4145 domain-containing protein n=1 Tax=Mesorhizobium sp. B2-6-2 TaxID=2589915 RepID=UPI00112948B2|nr:DUF4145 domain-containing protein [Mesorhizobium sp. B2-6-2]TPJ77173.1 DUF4145 domain-containing protein [Mesorhizobium sp. B2-6-2]